MPPTRRLTNKAVLVPHEISGTLERRSQKIIEREASHNGDS